jgi:hypothetical protein
MKHQIDFSKFSALGGTPFVAWSVTGKSGSLSASDGTLYHYHVFERALDLDAMYTSVHTIFWQQTGNPRASLIGGRGVHYGGSSLDPEATPIMARCIALHYISALQIMMATKPELPLNYDDRPTWEEEVVWLRDHIKKTDMDPFMLAHRALLIMNGTVKDGQKKRFRKSMWGTGFTYELVPTEYIHAVWMHRSEKNNA